MRTLLFRHCWIREVYPPRSLPVFKLSARWGIKGEQRMAELVLWPSGSPGLNPQVRCGVGKRLGKRHPPMIRGTFVLLLYTLFNRMK
ncbi:hypothetical protein NPIL_137441 [Nephila pilipes]|uniref:Uncharacterized protein n=1 Tax=Nephila pilipes TaxID=299642 RepID=A0A8X6PJ52_NEPPI|nr:hypothetical protein NPIL_137441 [Nephila pilipes]